MQAPWDDFTEQHFHAWLERVVHYDERPAVYFGVCELIQHNPDLLDRLGWSELRRLAERNAELGIR